MPDLVIDALTRNAHWLGRDLGHQLTDGRRCTEAEALIRGGTLMAATLKAHCARLGIPEHRIPAKVWEMMRASYLEAVGALVAE